ncbi:potassium channel family protein [Sporobolomyces koalae]|uniref:potassium channel family protein n=1 Tax=Sporobolomyces koalae TaxID=500713 RepID=UPI00317D6EB3
MPHFSLALMKGPPHPDRQLRYRTKTEIREHQAKIRWSKHRTFSLLAHILSPLSTLFAIPALSEHWYVQREVDGTIVATQPDPALVVVAGSFLLALSLVSNASILLRLLDVHCRLFTGTTAVFALCQFVLGLVTVVIFGAQHAQPDGYALSAAFWLTVVSAGIALGVVVSLAIDSVRAGWFAGRGTGLTGEQRSLVLVWNFFMVNVVVGAVAYRYLIPGSTFLDSTYFTVQCFITVGFGDVLPESVGARAFTIAFLTFGIVNFAILLAFIRSTALEAVKERYKRREKLTMERIKTRHSTIVANHSRRTALMIYFSCGLYHPKHQNSATFEAEPHQPVEKRFTYEKKIEEINRDQRQEFRSQLVTALIGVLLVWLLGALVFEHLESWSYWESIYFCFVSMSTLGLGDYAPQTQGGRAFFCFWALLGAGILTVLFSVIADEYSAHYKETFQRNIIATFSRGKRKEQPPKQNHTNSSHSSPQVNKPPTNTVDGKKERINFIDTDVSVQETEPKQRLIGLFSETHLQLRHLATGGSSDSDVIDVVVRRIMDEQGFAVRNRELVEQDQGMKDYIFSRNLLVKFQELEALTKELLKVAEDLDEQAAEVTEKVGGSSQAD